MAVGLLTVLPQQRRRTRSATAGATTTTLPQQQPSSLITLQVTPRQAEQIVQGTTSGRCGSASTRPDFVAGQFKNPTEIVDEINLFDQTLTELQKRALNFLQDPPPAAELP